MTPIIIFPYMLVAASALELIGGILIALVVLGVHTRILEERRIDNAVLKTVKRERFFVYFGLSFLIIGFVIECFVRFSNYFL